ncbi:hypothetical protein AOQ84DRAFT_365803 [Glonium stellatum]|uniref:Uncharacterized protein n=1 Tax=Glonium stellatum TaxID=574774 RepID=A0A8E2EXH9_9PEZI|nr:hypothetical protein AOQ84DRAFT_365803 [Glonium stellatum]
MARVDTTMYSIRRAAEKDEDRRLVGEALFKTREFGCRQAALWKKQNTKLYRYKIKMFALCANIEEFLTEGPAFVRPTFVEPPPPPISTTALPAAKPPPMNSGQDWTYEEDFNNTFINLIKDAPPHPLLKPPFGIRKKEFHLYIAEMNRLDTDIVIRQIKFIIKKFRALSPYHWTVCYDVWPLTNSPSELAMFGDHYNTQKAYIFRDGNDRQYLLFCRLRVEARSCENDIVVLDGDEWVSLEEWLVRDLPVFKRDILPLPFLQDYWDNNGGAFRFEALPNEIQDTIIAGCFFQQPTCYTPKLSKWSKGLFFWEIDAALGDYKSLSRTSISIRATVLKILFDKLELHCSTIREFHSTTYRTMMFPQLIISTAERLDKPFTRKDRYKLMEKYHDDPRLYPELQHYANMLQRVQRLFLTFKPVTALIFFEFNHGGYDWGKRKKQNSVNWEVLKTMPDLKYLSFEIPRLQEFQMAPMLFDQSNPCVHTMYGWFMEAAVSRVAAHKLAAHIRWHGRFIGHVVKEQLIRLKGLEGIFRAAGSLEGSDGGVPVGGEEGEGPWAGVYPPSCQCVPRCVTIMPIAD